MKLFAPWWTHRLRGHHMGVLVSVSTGQIIARGCICGKVWRKHE